MAKMQRVLHAALEGVSRAAGQKLSSHHERFSSGTHTSRDRAWPSHSQERCDSSANVVCHPGADFCTPCTSSNPMGFCTLNIPCMADQQRHSGAGAAANSLAHSQEHIRQYSATDAVNHLAKVQSGPAGVPAISSFDCARQHHGQLQASSLMDQTHVQPVLGSRATACSFARPPHKRPRQSSQDMSPACTACTQPGSAPAISSYRPVQHACRDGPSKISRQTLTGNAGALECKSLSSSGLGHDKAITHGAWPSRHRHNDDCTLCDGRAGSSDQGRDADHWHASTSADPGQADGAIYTSRGGSNIRLMVPEHELHLASLMQELAQPIADSNCCLLTDRLPILKTINRLRGISAPSVRFRSLYRRNIQVIPSSLAEPSTT